MKRITLTLTLLFFILTVPLSLLAAGEEHPASRSKEMPEKEAYEKSMKERLGKLGSQLDELKEKADAKKGRAEAEMKVHLADAEKKRQAAVRKLEELRQASKDSWEKFSAEAEKAATDFEQAFERAKTRME
jgi:hypothetical protein